MRRTDRTLMHEEPARRTMSCPPAGPVLLASDGTGAADVLCDAAQLAATRLHARVEVLGVCEPTPLVPAVGGGILAPPELDHDRQGAMRLDVRRAVSLSRQGDPGWPVDVRLGAPAEVLAREAEQRGACLMVMGIGRHNPLDRLLGTETTVSTLRRVHVPVLAVGAGSLAGLRHAVVGMDFSVASVRAAKLALRLVGARGQLTLVHVRPRFDHPSTDWRVWDQEYGRTLTRLFADVVSQLDAPLGVAVETVTVRGDPATALLAFAQQAGAGLLGVGTQRHGALDRLLVGSVATRVLRNARIATLVAPPPLVAGPAGLAPEGARVESSEVPAAWPAMLDEFARANHGRVATLECGPDVNSLRAIAQALAFTGATVDSGTGSVCTYLARITDATPEITHLTHVDQGVARINIVRNAAGGDLGLVLRHGSGVTRLSFT